MSKSEYDVVSLDWTIDPVKARSILGPNKTLQGNLDPCALYASAEDLKAKVKQMGLLNIKQWLSISKEKFTWVNKKPNKYINKWSDHQLKINID